MRKTDRSLTSIHELMLSEEDGHKIAELSDFKRLRQKLCEQNRATLKFLAAQDDTFTTIRVASGQETIVYIKNGLITIPKCARLQEIELIQQEGICFQDLQVRFQLGSKLAKGYLTTGGIVRSESAAQSCEGKRYIRIPEINDTFIVHENGRAWIETKSHVVKVEDIEDAGIKYNFPHYQAILEEIDMLHALHWDEVKKRSIEEQVEKSWDLHNGKLTFSGTNMLEWVSERMSEYRKLLVIISVLVVIVSIVLLVIILFFRCRIYKRRATRKRFQLPKRDHLDPAVQLELKRLNL